MGGDTEIAHVEKEGSALRASEKSGLGLTLQEEQEAAGQEIAVSAVTGPGHYSSQVSLTSPAPQEMIQCQSVMLSDSPVFSYKPF